MMEIDERIKWKDGNPPDADDVKAYIEELANGWICPECKGVGTLGCVDCYDDDVDENMGSIEPNPRLMDALICMSLDRSTKVWFNDKEIFPFPDWEYESNTRNKNIYLVPAYTTEWASGGPLLKGFPAVTIDLLEAVFWKVSIIDGCGPDALDYNFIHESELMARCMAYLFWAIMSGKLESMP